MKKKLFVTGCGGFVAGSVIAQAKDEWDVHAVGRRDVSNNKGDMNYCMLDLLESDKLTKLYHNINPEAIIHAAAMANIDFCQNNHDIAEKVNVGITNTLADLYLSELTQAKNNEICI